MPIKAASSIYCVFTYDLKRYKIMILLAVKHFNNLKVHSYLRW